ncbi:MULTISPECIES: YoaK family protein [Sphingomonas]|jgi:uncharacterized membrane protein YoaK (UPF0700 family)|uniref:YoaK family protein n=1 Tax=Sphingomonas TaxID=13687 RepID=UPI001AEEFA69|nr:MULTISPECIES: YoaK family protein [Sphingomonas]
MRRYPRRLRMLAIGLAALAGYVDAVGFLALGGFFVSFMSGNSTQLGIGLASQTHAAAIAGGLVATFVLGVTGGSVVAEAAGARRAPAVLVLVALLLATAAVVEGRAGGIAAAFVLAVAMGAENAIFAHEGEVTVGLTYMTGTLVRLGQRIAALVRGEDAWGWLPHLALWTALTAGAAAGAAARRWCGADAIWLAAAVAGMLAILSLIAGPPGGVSRSDRGAAGA